MKKVVALPLELSFLLSAYVLWPTDGDEPKRNSWVSTLSEAVHIAHNRKTALSEVSEVFGGISSLLGPALSSLNHEVLASEAKLIPVGDIFLRLVDIQFADLDLRGGASIAKAIDLCASDVGGKSQSALYKSWSDYKDVGHLIAASALLAGQTDTRIFYPLWFAPESVLSLAAGYQEFGLKLFPHGRDEPVLSPETIWEIPSHCCPPSLFIRKRQLSPEQIKILTARKAR